jgi:hypothetical protein
MKKTPSTAAGWLIQVLLLLPPVGPTEVALLPMITHNPLRAALLLLIDAVVVGFLTFLAAFLRTLWDRLAEVSVGCMETKLRLRVAPAPRRSRPSFRYEHHDLERKGISRRGTSPLDVEHVFVERRINPTPAHQASLVPASSPLGTAQWHPRCLTGLPEPLVILGARGNVAQAHGPPLPRQETPEKRVGTHAGQPEA